MTPLQIEIMLHYNCRVEDYRFGDLTAPAVKEAIEWFVETEMLAPVNDAEYPNANYSITEKGRFFIDALCRIPLPINTWKIPMDWVAWAGE